MKVILNKCYGGLSFSPRAYLLYAEKKGIGPLYIYAHDYECGSITYKKMSLEEYENSIHYIDVTYTTKDVGDVVKSFDAFTGCYFDKYPEGLREDPVMVEVVEELGQEANGPFSERLVIVDIPDGMDYVIDDYDGYETLHQRVQEW